MTNFEKMVKSIKKEFKAECKYHDNCSIRELFKIFQYSKKELIEEFQYIVDHTKGLCSGNNVCDDGDVVVTDEDRVIPFNELKKAVCK